MPGPGGFVLVKCTFVPGEGEEKTVKLYDGEPRIDWLSPDVQMFDECIPR